MVELTSPLPATYRPTHVTLLGVETAMFRWRLTTRINVVVLRRSLTALALSYVNLCLSSRIPKPPRRRHTLPNAATLSLLWVDGPIRPVTPSMFVGQKHSLAMVQPSPGRVGPLLTDIVPLPVLKLMILKCLGLPIQQLKMAVRFLRVLPVVPCRTPLNLPLQKTPLLSITV